MKKQLNNTRFFNFCKKCSILYYGELKSRSIKKIIVWLLIVFEFVSAETLTAQEIVSLSVKELIRKNYENPNGNVYGKEDTTSNDKKNNRDYVLSRKSEAEIIKEVSLKDTTSNEIIIIRESNIHGFGRTSSKRSTKKYDVNNTKTKHEEVFVEKTIIDNHGTEQKVFVRSELNVRDEINSTNRNITISYRNSTPEYQNIKNKHGLTAEDKTNIKIGIFTPLVVLSIIFVPTAIAVHRNPSLMKYGY